MKVPVVLCRICAAETKMVGTIVGKLRPQAFHLHSCPNCSYSFISNPWMEYDKIYSHDYYCGRGADPLVDYIYELKNPKKTIRLYEWRGILKIISSLTKIGSETRWLDYGCGNGGLVRYCKNNSKCNIVGFEQGSIKEKFTSLGVSHVDREDLEKMLGTFDIVTAVEVLEHLQDPLGSIKSIRALLKPGGLFFYTTGNAEPFRDRLLTWRYIIPEIHISFFEPRTLDYALKKSGFKTETGTFMSGHVDIIRYKILKNLRWKTRSLPERILPWVLLSRIIDKKYGITAHPIAWA